MISLLAASFHRDFARLPPRVQRRAGRAYRRFEKDPFDPALGFKRLNTVDPWWSVRLPGGYRVVGSRVESDTIVWFFVGTHADYDRLLGRN